MIDENGYPGTRQEEWRVIPGYPNYEVSTLGNVRRITGGQGAVAGRLLKGKMSSLGYQLVHLHKKNKPVHRLVMLAFVGPSDLSVNHKNGIKTDNRLVNLEYCTHSQNQKHAYETGLRTHAFGNQTGIRNRQAKLTPTQVLAIREETGSCRTLANRFGVSPQHISRIKNGLRRAHG